MQCHLSPISVNDRVTITESCKNIKFAWFLNKTQKSPYILIKTNNIYKIEFNITYTSTQ